MASPSRLPVLLLLAGLVVVSLSCSTERRIATPLAPSVSSAERALEEAGAASGSARALYPIHLGNHWSWTRELETHYQINQDPPIVSGFTVDVDQDQVCDEFQDGRVYTIERITENSDLGTYYTWVRVRQDRTGLYEADDTSQPACATAPERSSNASRAVADPVEERWNTIAARIPAAQQVAARKIFDRHELITARIRELIGMARPTTLAEPELLRLKYPLRTGSSWTVRGNPLFVETVEGVDALDTVAGTQVGYRIRMDSELFGPDDRVWFWYGRSGFLQLRAHLEGEGTDPEGHVFNYVTEDSYTLTELSLIEDQGPPQP